MSSSRQRTLNFALTLVAKKEIIDIKSVITQITDILLDNNTEVIDYQLLEKNCKAVDLFLVIKTNDQDYKKSYDNKDILSNIAKKLRLFSSPLAIDFCVQELNLVTRRKKVFFSDMDSTMINNETLDDFAKLAGVKQEIAEITKLGIEGKIGFQESLNKRMELLKGIEPHYFFQHAISSLKYNQGSEALIRAFNHFGIKTVLVSGGFNPMANEVKKYLGFDELYCNEFEIIEGKLTGRLLGKMTTANAKLTVLIEVLKQKGYLMEHACAIGDGANDLDMIKKAGLGIAYQAVNALKQEAICQINHTDLLSVLYFQGYKFEEFSQFIES